MRDFLDSLFGMFLTWWGLFVLAALDSSLLFFLPFGIDTLVVYMVAANRELFWLYPLMATAGSIAGAAVTYWVGAKAGEAGLPRLIPARRLQRVQARVQRTGAVAMALPAALPPPFPLTPFILTCGALRVSPPRFFAVFSSARLVRFGVEALLARRYGRRVLFVMQSDAFQYVVVGFVVLATTVTIASAVVLWRRARPSKGTGARRRPRAT